MKLYQFVAIMAFVLSIASCGSNKFLTKAKDGETEMYLKKGACFGKCPVYALEIKKGGIANLDAKMNVNGKLGKYTKKLSKEAYTELLQAFKESNFAQFPADYKSMIPDLPMIRVGYMTADTLQITQGKEDRPSELMQLQYRLEKLVQARDWELVEAYKEAMEEEKKEDLIIESEIILLVKPGTNLPRFFRSYEAQKLRVLKKVSPNENYWLATYDQGVIKPAEMLKLLKEDDAIKEAEFNKKTSNRN